MKIIKKQIWFYWNRGFSIIPLKKKSKTPNIETWKQYQKRKPTRKEIETWLEKGLFENIGIICGEISDNLVVLDLDDDKIVNELDINLEETMEQGFWVVKTGGEGRYHIYCKNDKKTGDTRRDAIVHIEYRANGGYVVAPPSIHPNGNQYHFLGDCELEDLPELKEKDVHELYENMVKRLKEKGIFQWEKQCPSIKDIKKGVKEGNRNNSAFLLSCHYRDKGDSIEETKQKLTEWNIENKPSLGLSELNKTIESAYTYPVNFRMKETSLMYKYGVFKKNDEGKYLPKVNCPNLAKLLLESDDRKYIVAKDNSMIYRWNGSYYKDDGETELKQRINHYLDSSYTVHRENEVVRYVKNQNLIERENFETPDHVINLKNGVYNQKKGILEPHSPDYYFLYEIPVEYDPEATCSKIEEFMEQIFDTRDIPYLYKFIGDCLQPTYKFKKAMILIGPTDTGKSQFLNMLEHFLGPSNVSHVSLSKLCNDRFAGSDLYGKLANIRGELDDTTIKTTDQFLMATGRDTIRADEKFEKAFNFKNYAKLIFSCNEIPVSENRNDAYYNRWILIEADNQIPEEKKIQDFYKTLCTDHELSGLLNHALNGLKELEKEGYQYYRTSEQIRKFMESKSKPYIRFCTQFINTDWGNEITKSELYEKYKHYCKSEYYPVMASNMFSRFIKKWFPLSLDEGQSGTLEGRPKVWRNITCNYEIEEQEEQ